MAEIVYSMGRTKSGKDRMRWLLKFAGLNLDKITPGEQLDYWLQVQYFHSPFLHLNREKTTVSSLPQAKLQELKELQADVKEGLQAMRDRRRWTLPEAPSWWTVISTTRSVGVAYQGNLRQMFLAAVADVLRESWPLVRECGNPECKALFLPHRRQSYCRPECSQRVRWKRFTEKGRKRDYHREYKREVERKIKPGLNIQPKKPKKRGKSNGRKTGEA